MAMRTCIKCGEEKPLTAEYFYRDKKSASGYFSYPCKICRNKSSKKWRKENPEKSYNSSKKFREENPERFLAIQKKWREKNRESERLRASKYREANREKVRATHKKYYEANREQLIAANTKYKTERRRNDPTFKLQCNLQRGLWGCLSGKSKKCRTLEYVGMDAPKLWKYFESKFTDGMTRENYGEWHVDHIRPLSSFDFDQFKQGSEEYENLIHEAWHYTNLQPLWAKDNMSKQGKWEGAL